MTLRSTFGLLLLYICMSSCLRVRASSDAPQSKSSALELRTIGLPTTMHSGQVLNIWVGIENVGLTPIMFLQTSKPFHELWFLSDESGSSSPQQWVINDCAGNFEAMHMLLPGDSYFVAYSFEAPKKPGRVKAVLRMRLSLLDSGFSCTGVHVFPKQEMEIEVTR